MIERLTLRDRLAMLRDDLRHPLSAISRVVTMRYCARHGLVLVPGLRHWYSHDELAARRQR
ncbi:hypothetical protein PBI_HILLTOPFARM_131 [Mycobacterium phage Hilltopfarm]|nr:hypothetical protein PBI_HILLTOPFARM_131 [Mycobacterium phage Hilltopfarm]